MKLYHGTSLSMWHRIQHEGLKPRVHTGNSNWECSVESSPTMTYLTSTYPVYFAIAAAEANKDRVAVVIEIDVGTITHNLLPDEDFLEQCSRGSDWHIVGGMKERTQHFRDNLRMYSNHGFDWQMSLNTLGACAHEGTIPPHLFTMVLLVDVFKERGLACYCMDATITPMNNQFVGFKYRNLVKSLFKDPDLEPDPFFGGAFQMPPISGNGVQLINLR